MKDSSKKKKERADEKRNERISKENSERSGLTLISKNQEESAKKMILEGRKNWEELAQGYSLMEVLSESVSEKRSSTTQIKGINTKRDSIHKFWERLEEALDTMNSDNEYTTLPYNEWEEADVIQRKLIKAVELSPSSVIIISREGLIEYVNPHFQQLSGYSMEELLGKEIGVLISDLVSHEEYEQILRSIKNGLSWSGEPINRKKNGDWFIFSSKIAPVQQLDGTIINFVMVGEDITPFRETEIRLEQAIEEKSLLLSELHHRVKNNLAIVSGMIQLQAISEEDEYVQDKLLSSVSRVKTLASMHEQLFESGSFSRLEFSRNIRGIVTNIARDYEEPGQHIEVDFDLIPLVLNINQAHPCSLIMNEVIINIYKHSFKDIEEGILSIKMSLKDSKITIIVGDNGKGFPEGFHEGEENKPNLSYQFLKTLVRQLNGTFYFDTTPEGSLFFLSFDRQNIKGTANAKLF